LYHFVNKLQGKSQIDQETKYEEQSILSEKTKNNEKYAW